MEGDKPLQTTDKSTFFQEDEPKVDIQETPPQEDMWVVAEPDLVNPQLWVESRFGNGRRFDSMADCNRYIRLNPEIDNLVKVGLKPKKESQLKG
jgi:hypothetical protein